MEVMLQYWDDLDDLVGVIGLLAEKIRRVALFALATLAFLTAVGAAMVLAYYQPPFALAMLTVLVVEFMYLSVTVSPPRPAGA